MNFQLISNERPAPAPAAEPAPAPEATPAVTATPVPESTPMAQPEQPAAGATPAPTETTPTTSETPAVSEEEGALAQPQKPNRPFVSRLIRENERLKQEQQQREAQIAYLTQQLSRTPPPAGSTGSSPSGGRDPVDPLTATTGSAPGSRPQDRPRPEQFPTHEAWVEALADWKYEQRTAQAEAQRASRTAQEQWAAREAEGRTKYPDYDEAMATLQIAPHVAGVIADTVRESAQGADILYYVANHPDEQARLNRLSPVAAARYLGQLEQRLSAPPAPQQPQPTPAPSPAPAPAPAAGSAPPPVRPLAGGGSGTPVLQDAASIARRQGSLRDYLKAAGPYRP